MNKTKIGMAAVLTTSLLLFAHLSRADDVASLVERMRTGQTELAGLTPQMESLTSLQERDLKERKLYDENFGQMEARKKALIATFRSDADRRLKSANDMVEDWNRQCAKDRVGELSKGAYDACAARRAQVGPVVSGIREGVKRDADVYFKNNIAPIIDVQKRQLQGMNDISTRMKERFKAWEALKAKSDALKAELMRIRTVLVDSCKTAKTMESLKHCHSVGWDGARQDLPPLTNIMPPNRVTPNR